MLIWRTFSKIPKIAFKLPLPIQTFTKKQFFCSNPQNPYDLTPPEDNPFQTAHVSESQKPIKVLDEGICSE